MSNQLTPESEAVTLESVFKSIQHWRAHKDEYPGRAIPDEIWKEIFALAEQDDYSPSTVRQLFKLNSEQYNRKHQALMGKTSSDDKTIIDSVEDNKVPSPAIPFGEAVANPDIPALKAAADKTKKAVKTLKSTAPFEMSMLDPMTAVVECIRPDGHRLKIHITAQRLDVLIEAFFSQASVS